MQCHGSANLATAIPNWVPPEIDPDADNAASRGTYMHELFAGVAGLSTKDMRMMAMAIEYVADIRGRRRFQVLIEQSVEVRWLRTRPKTIADLVLYVADEMHIFDLKTGTIPVEARENAQMLYYAATYGELAPKAKGVYLHIVQPWADNMEAWFASTARIGQFMAEAKTAEQRIQMGDVSLMPGDYCQFCAANPHSRAPKGRPYCPAMMQLLYPQVAVDEDAVLQLGE